jgi:Secretion system C-terminal sorting domain
MKEIYQTKFGRLFTQFGLALALTAATSLSLQAQEDHIAPATLNDGEAFPGYQGPSNEPSYQTDALWSVQLDANITANASSVGCAAGQYVKNAQIPAGEFWVSKWQSDTLMRFSNTGTLLQKFQIPGLTGTRSLAFDGTYLYAGANTTTIYRIDPVTKTLAPPHINSGSANSVRHCSYDPTLNSGAGGFWVGNFGTDIDAISMSGTVLTSIPSSSHGLTGMYGSAYDPYTSGGPYLWIFDQSGANTTQIQRITIATGATSPLASHNTFPDFATSNSLTSGLAGGLFVTDQFVSGQFTIGGVIQGTPNNVLFAYELANLQLANDDAAASGLRPTKGYTRIPNSQTFGETYTVQATNAGGNAISMMHVDFTVKYNGGATVFTNTQMSSGSVASGQSVTLTSAAFSPANGVGTYDITAVAYPMTGSDPNHINDTTHFQLLVTDSTFARDDDQPDGGAGYAVSGTDWAYAVALFEVNRADSLSSVWIELANPVSGDTTYAVVASAASGQPGAVLFTGPVQIIGAANQMVLPVPGGLSLAQGSYFIGCYEGGISTINLAQSASVFTPGMNFFFTPTNGWTQSGVQTARFIRPNFGTVVGVGVDNGFTSGVHVYPNPSNDKFFVSFRDQLNADVTICVTNVVGQQMRKFTMNPSLQSMTEIDLTGEAEGIYFVRIQNGEQSTVRKVVLTR